VRGWIVVGARGAIVLPTVGARREVVGAKGAIGVTGVGAKGALDDD
jgi:hypothetical protein